MLLNALYYAFLFCFYNNNFQVFSKLYYVIIPIISLLQPFFYFYIKTLTNPYFKCSKRQILHFMPTFVFLLLNIIFYSQLSSNEQHSLFGLKNIEGNKIYQIFYYLHIEGYHIILSIQALVYFVMIIRLVYVHRKNMPENFSNYEGVNLNWLVTLLVLFLTISVFQEIVGNIKDISTNVNSRVSYNVFMMITLSFIGIAGIKQKEIYLNLFEKQNDNIESNDENNIEEIKYKSSSLSDIEKQNIAKNLKILLEEKKVFLDNDLKLDNLVVELDTNRQYLSQIINEIYGQNFYALINKYRIEESKKMFFNKKHKQMTIMGIANTVGFNSKSTFNTLFKKNTGKTPSQFIKENNL